jgi:hypothetical protein
VTPPRGTLGADAGIYACGILQLLDPYQLHTILKPDSRSVQLLLGSCWEAATWARRWLLTRCMPAALYQLRSAGSGTSLLGAVPSRWLPWLHSRFTAAAAGASRAVGVWHRVAVCGNVWGTSPTGGPAADKAHWESSSTDRWFWPPTGLRSDTVQNVACFSNACVLHQLSSGAAGGRWGSPSGDDSLSICAGDNRFRISGQHRWLSPCGGAPREMGGGVRRVAPACLALYAALWPDRCRARDVVSWRAAAARQLCSG